jgi:hypothetical protein
VEDFPPLWFFASSGPAISESSQRGKKEGGNPHKNENPNNANPEILTMASHAVG